MHNHQPIFVPSAKQTMFLRAVTKKWTETRCLLFFFCFIHFMDISMIAVFMCLIVYIHNRLVSAFILCDVVQMKRVKCAFSYRWSNEPKRDVEKEKKTTTTKELKVNKTCTKFFVVFFLVLFCCLEKWQEPNIQCSVSFAKAEAQIVSTQ